MKYPNNIDFLHKVQAYVLSHPVKSSIRIRCTLKGSLAFTGKGHATDRAVLLGIYDFTPQGLAEQDVNKLVSELWKKIRSI